MGSKKQRVTAWEVMPDSSQSARVTRRRPLSSKYGTFRTVKARFRPLLQGTSPSILSCCSLFARTRMPRAAQVQKEGRPLPLPSK